MDSNRLIRSKKLQTLSDAQIIKRYADRPLGEERHFLDIEIEQRNLKDQADSATKKKQLRRQVRLLRLGWVFSNIPGG